MIEVIDKKALIEHLNKTFYGDVIEEIKKFPVIMKVNVDLLEHIEKGTFVSSPIEVIKVGEPLSNSDEITKTIERRMTSEEAIKYLIRPVATSTKSYNEYLKQKEAYDLAIMALEYWEQTKEVEK